MALRERSPIIEVSSSLFDNEQFLLKFNQSSLFQKIYITPDENLYNEIDRRKKEARNLSYNFYQTISKDENNKNFYYLYFLSPEKIEFLKIFI